LQDYLNRTLPARWELEEMALLLNLPRARKPTGFRSSAGFTARDEDNAATEETSSEE